MSNRNRLAEIRCGILAILTCVLVAAGNRAEAQSRGGEQRLQLEQVNLKTEDDVAIQGFLHYPSGSKPEVVIFYAHPRGGASAEGNELLRPIALRTGIALFGTTSRFKGEHPIAEERVLDIAAGMKYLRERGFRKIVFFGHSGGGSFLTFYQRQAETSPPGRVSSTPAGEPPDLNKFNLPKADAVIISNAHEGEGLHFMHQIDGSMLDEGNPFAVDASLDMFNPANGFQTPPNESHYSKDFVKRFREAQKARVARLDAIAHTLIEDQNYYAKLMKTPDYKDMPPLQQLDIRRRALLERWLIILGAEADPVHLDLGLRAEGAEEYSHGTVGSTFNRRTDVTNYAGPTWVKFVTPRAWLSNLSGLSMQYNLYKDISKISCPLLVIAGTAERGAPSTEKLTYFNAAKVKDKKLVWIVGANHEYNPDGPRAGKGDQLEQFHSAVSQWVQERFLARQQD